MHSVFQSCEFQSRGALILRTVRVILIMHQLAHFDTCTYAGNQQAPSLRPLLPMHIGVVSSLG